MTLVQFTSGSSLFRISGCDKGPNSFPAPTPPGADASYLTRSSYGPDILWYSLAARAPRERVGSGDKTAIGHSTRSSGSPYSTRTVLFCMTSLLILGSRAELACRRRRTWSARALSLGRRVLGQVRVGFVFNYWVVVSTCVSTQHFSA